MFAKLTYEELKTLRDVMRNVCAKGSTIEIRGDAWEIRFDIIKEMVVR